jgi:hypothetical protein
VANTNAPNGFQYFGRLEGGSPTEGLTPALVSSGDTNALGYGDLVMRTAGGYITKATVSTTTVPYGVFYGCSYLSTAISRVVFQNYWGGSGSGSDVSCLICTDPQATFIAQSDNTAITFADIGANINFVTGTPNATTQMSTMAVGQSLISTTNTLPFRIVGLLSQSSPPGTDGTDNASAYNRVIVQPNNWDRQSSLGIV